MSGKENWAPPSGSGSGYGAVFNQQPGGSAVTVIDASPGNVNSSAMVESYPGCVSIRPLRDGPEDTEFAARLLIEAFRGKFVYAVGETK